MVWVGGCVYKGNHQFSLPAKVMCILIDMLVGNMWCGSVGVYIRGITSSLPRKEVTGMICTFTRNLESPHKGFLPQDHLKGQSLYMYL